MLHNQYNAFNQVKRNSTMVLLLCILVLSFLLKIIYFRLDPTVSRDGCMYIRLAQEWYDTGVFPEMISKGTPNYLPPFFLFLIKCLMHVGLSAEGSGFFLNILLGTFTPLLSYGISKEITQRKDISICSALLTAVNPSMNTLSVAVQRDMIYLFFIGLALWSISAGIRRNQWQFWLGAGFICGCAMLTRFETIEFVILVPMILFCLLLGKHITVKKVFSYAICYFFFFFASIFVLSFLMNTQDIFLKRYNEYYQIKYQIVRNSPKSEFDFFEK